MKVVKRCGNFHLFYRQPLVVAPWVQHDELLIYTPCENGANVRLHLIDGSITAASLAHYIAHHFKISSGQVFCVFVAHELSYSVNLFACCVDIPVDKMDDLLACFVVIIWVGAKKRSRQLNYS